MSTLLGRGLVISLTWLLVLPFFGPALDHHFAERHHNHTHIYLADPDARHPHPYESPHSHSYGPGENGHMEPPLSEPGTNGIVYLASYQAMEQETATPFGPDTKLALMFPHLGDNSFFSNPGQVAGIFQEEFVAPPKKPPKG